MKILFVDDDPVTLDLMGQAARLLGYEATLARNGAAAIQNANEEHPELIFLDLMMPDMDGLSVLKKLKGDAVTADIPVIILSAGASYDDHQVCMDAGANGYMYKPVPLAELMSTFKKYENGKK